MFKTLTTKLAPTIFWLFIWQLVSVLVANPIFLPAPLAVFETFIAILSNSDNYAIIAYSVVKIFTGFFISILSAMILSFMAYKIKYLDQLLTPFVIILKSIPIVSIIIVLLIIFPSRLLSFIIVFFIVFPIMYTNLLSGFISLDQKMLEMAQVFNLTILDKLRYIYWPHLETYFMANLKVTIGLAWKSGIAAEVIGMPDKSIGVILQTAKVYLATQELFAWSFLIIMLSYLSEKFILWGFRHFSNYIMERSL